MTVWLSGYQYLEGDCLKAKAVYDCRIITLHFPQIRNYAPNMIQKRK